MKRIQYALIVTLLVGCGSNESSENQVEENVNEEGTVVADSSDVAVEEGSIVNDWSERNLIGEVKSISIHAYQVDEEGEEMGMGGSYEGIEFNERGFITEETAGGCCGAADELISYKRDENDRLTHRIFKLDYDYEGITEETPLDHKEKYFYKDDVLVKVKVAGADSVLTTEYIYSYDDQGEVEKMEVVDAETETSYFITYKTEGNQKTTSYEYSDEANNYKVVSISDENGIIQSEKMHRADGSIYEQEFTYEYDDIGNWTKKTSKYRYTYPDNPEKNEEWRLSYKETRTIKYF